VPAAACAGVDAAAIPQRLALRGLMVLTLINLLNYLDRYVVAALLPALKRADMGLTDLLLGTLTTSFVLVYMLAAPVFGALGDRRSRPRSIAAGVFIWSLATALAGLARNYWHLLGARAVVGIGEAAYGTIAPALLADYFPLRTRGRVFAVFYMAIPVGSALGYVLGGLIDHWYGWRAAFFVAGIPGLALAAWVLRLPDPPRGVQEQADVAAVVPLPLRTVYGKLLRQAAYVVTVLGYAAYTFALGGLAAWMPTFLERVRGVPESEATTLFGAIVVLTGFFGTFAGGWLGDFWLRYSRQAYLTMSGIATVLAVPFVAIALTAPAPSTYYPAIVAAELLLFMSTGPINSAIINLVAPGERATAIALSVFTIHILGDAISPPLIGLLSDRSSLGNAFLVVPVATAVSGILWLAAARIAQRPITART
jgi:MFS family permease